MYWISGGGCLKVMIVNLAVLMKHASISSVLAQIGIHMTTWADLLYLHLIYCPLNKYLNVKSSTYSGARFQV